MKSKISILLLVLSSALSGAQIILPETPLARLTTVTGTVQTGTSAVVTKGAYVQFDLMYCGSNQARVIAAADLQTSFKVPVSSTGTVPTSLYGNDVITCGSVTGGTRWQWQVFINNQPAGAACRQYISGASADLTSDLCDNAQPPPVAPAAYDVIHLRADGGNQMSGNIVPTANATYGLGNNAARWKAYLSSLDVSGAASVASLNGVQFAATATDTCANIATQIAALPSTGGFVFAPPPGNQTCTSNPFAGNTKPVTLVLSPASTYVSTQTWLVTSSNTYIIGNGATIDFEPTGSFTTLVNDRAIAFDWAEPTQPADRNITGAIAIGATSFAATSSSDVTGIVPGDWLHIWEWDTGVGDVWVFDWVQVASVSGTTVNMVRPFRMAFPNTHAGTKFDRLTVAPVENVGISGCTIKSDEASEGKPAIAVMRVRNAKIKDNVINNARGQSLYSYRSQGATFEGNKVLARAAQDVASEFAESVDLVVKGNRWEAEAVSTPPAGFTDVVFDYAAGFFQFTGNTILSNGYPLALDYGVHDGLVSGNSFSSYVGSADRIGITGAGAVRNTISNNLLNGGNGATVGIQLLDASSMSPAVASAGNLVSENQVLNYVTPYQFNPTTTDIVRGGLALPYSLLPYAADGSLLYCSDCVEASPAAGSGTGGLAKRQNGAWTTSFTGDLSLASGSKYKIGGAQITCADLDGGCPSGTITTANGAQWIQSSISELITLDTGGLTTDSTADLLPAKSVIQGVVARVTADITGGCIAWAIGDGSTYDRFVVNDFTLTSGETQVGFTYDSTRVQDLAAKLRITCATGNPDTGAIRVTVFYSTFLPPQS